MARKNWEFRVNGIRSSGDTFPSYDAAIRRMFQEINRLHFATQGEERDHNGRQESVFIADADRLKGYSPRLDVTIKCLRNGKPWALQINRLPWGSAPSGASYRNGKID